MVLEVGAVGEEYPESAGGGVVGGLYCLETGLLAEEGVVPVGAGVYLEAAGGELQREGELVGRVCFNGADWVEREGGEGAERGGIAGVGAGEAVLDRAGRGTAVVIGCIVVVALLSQLHDYAIPADSNACTRRAGIGLVSSAAVGAEDGGWVSSIGNAKFAER